MSHPHGSSYPTPPQGPYPGALNPAQAPSFPSGPGGGYPGAAAHYQGPPPPVGSYPAPTGPPPMMHSPQPSSQALAPAGAEHIQTTGDYEGVRYTISYRDSNSLLSLRIPQGQEVKAKPGAMVAMDPTVAIKGKMKFSFKKMMTGGELSESIFSGQGEVLLAPEIWGDIVPIVLDGRTQWSFGRDAFLACTKEVVRNTKSQGVGKALFSGEGLFVYHATGRGIIWVQALGAILQRQLREGEQWIVDNGHLVAWTAKYNVERVAAGGLLSQMHTDEGLVCRFTGPGVVYIQTRNPETLTGWIRAQLPSQ